MPKNNNFDRRGGTPNSGLRGLVKDDVAKRSQRIMRGNAALIASLKPALTPQALEVARVRVVMLDAREAADALREKAVALTGLIPDYSAQEAVRTQDVDVLAGDNSRRPWEPATHFVLKWDDHGSYWNEAKVAESLLELVEDCIETWEEWRAALKVYHAAQEAYYAMTTEVIA